MGISTRSAFIRPAALVFTGLFAGLMGLSGSALAAGCKIPDPTAKLALVERNIASAEKMLKGAESDQIAALRARTASLKSSGGAFRGKAAPLEEKCEALTREMASLKAAKTERDAALQPLYAQRKAMIDKYKDINDKLKAARAHRDTQLKPYTAQREALMREYKSWKQRWDAHQARRPSHCHETDWKKTGCTGIASSWNSQLARLRSERDANKGKFSALNAKTKPIGDEYKRKRRALEAQRKAVGDYKGLNAKIKDIQAKYAAKAKAFEARRKALTDGYNAYAGEVKAWDGDARKLWADTQRIVQQAMASARRQPSGRAGGELGKLSGSFAPGSAHRTPGSPAVPPGQVERGEGGAKGQARAAARTGGDGKRAGTGAGAAFEAGRVFDRGDVRVGPASGKGAVDARGVTPRSYPKAVTESDGFRRLEARERSHRAAKAKAEVKIKEIEKKLQSGEGDKGKLQVELVRMRDQADRAQNQINQVSVEKESFAISFEEKKPANGPAGGGN